MNFFTRVYRHLNKVRRITLPVVCLIIFLAVHSHWKSNLMVEIEKGQEVITETPVKQIKEVFNLQDTGSSRRTTWNNRSHDEPSLPGTVDVNKDKDVPFSMLLRDYENQIEVLKKGGYWHETPSVKSCSRTPLPGAPCTDTNCSTDVTTSLKERLKGVLSSMDGYDRDGLREITRRLGTKHTHKKVLFITAGSSNHYRESQALLHNLNTEVFPFISNYTFVFYDIGLTEQQQKEMKMYCGCEVRTFPLSALPPGVRDLLCYTWKPLIAYANLPTADNLIYMDASVRFQKNMVRELLLSLQNKRLSFNWGRQTSLAQHTTAAMFEYFHEEPCTFSHIPELTAGLLILANTRFIREAVLRPWAACALTSKCMCPYEREKVMRCRMRIRKYHKCHRFDQSALGIILVKLFRGHEVSVHLRRGTILLRRNKGRNYFETLRQSNSTKQRANKTWR